MLFICCVGVCFYIYCVGGTCWFCLPGAWVMRLCTLRCDCLDDRCTVYMWMCVLCGFTCTCNVHVHDVFCVCTYLLWGGGMCIVCYVCLWKYTCLFICVVYFELMGAFVCLCGVCEKALVQRIIIQILYN